MLVTLADLHVASPFAVCPPQWTLHDGNPFTPNELQHVIRRHWLTCWQRVAELRAGGRLLVVVAGDATEGVHHGTTQILTPRLDEQEAMAVAVIEEGLHTAHFNLLAGDRLRFCVGTDAHDGDGAGSLERIARTVTDADGNGRVTRDNLQFAINGVRFAVTHKPGSGPGSRLQTQGNAYQSWLKSLYLARLEQGDPLPRYVLSAHYHQYLQRPVYRANGELALTGVMLPAWKVADAYIAQAAPFALGTVGMFVVVIAADGTTRDYCWRIPVGQPACEEL